MIDEKLILSPHRKVQTISGGLPEMMKHQAVSICFDLETNFQPEMRDTYGL